MDKEHVFDDILDSDEQIIGIIKPSKGRYWKDLLAPMLTPFIIHYIILIFCTLIITLPLLFAHAYKNLYYAYTNKRLIVRKGMIGVDYKTLDYKNVTSTSVNVGLLDKGIKKTGTLSFKSSADSIDFKYVENPYDMMREIKDYMNTIEEYFYARPQPKLQNKKVPTPIKWLLPEEQQTNKIETDEEPAPKPQTRKTSNAKSTSKVETKSKVGIKKQTTNSTAKAGTKNSKTTKNNSKISK